MSTGICSAAAASRLSTTMSSIGPQLPPHLLAAISKPDVSGDEDDANDPSPSPPSASIGPQIPSTVSTAGPQLPDAEADSDDDYAPALPPGFSVKPATAHTAAVSAPAPSGRVVGPTMPSHPARHEDDDSEDEIGPSPFSAGPSARRDAVAEFREREESRRKALEVRLLAAMCPLHVDHISQEAAKPKKVEREEWMLKPPSASDLLSSMFT
jgi:hypothetical protein